MALKDLLIKPKKGFFTKIKEVFVGKNIDDDLYEELEELLIQSDIGMAMTMKIVQDLTDIVDKKGIKTTDKVYEELKSILSDKILDNKEVELKLTNDKLSVILIVGVNGVGKTTSIAKIANKLKNEGKKILIGAGDTFRAAAIEQIDNWGNKINVEVIKHKSGSDPSGVVYDTVVKAKKDKYDVAIIDTAGRLHNKVDLMKELEKIRKIILNNVSEDELETLLVIDSTTGQNGLIQAKVFNEITKLTGLILTKFDGTSKGGIILPIVEELKVPIKFIGAGEGMNDLKVFDSKEFVDSMFENNDEGE